jgi:hypothetical protein
MIEVFHKLSDDLVEAQTRGENQVSAGSTLILVVEIFHVGSRFVLLDGRVGVVPTRNIKYVGKKKSIDRTSSKDSKVSVVSVCFCVWFWFGARFVCSEQQFVRSSSLLVASIVRVVFIIYVLFVIDRMLVNIKEMMERFAKPIVAAFALQRSNDFCLLIETSAKRIACSTQENTNNIE